MATDNASRDSSSRQQSSERAAAGPQTAQQGSPWSGSPGSGGVTPWQRSRGGALQRRGTSMSGDDYGGGPFSVMRRISDEMDRFFENFGMGRGFPGFEQGGFGEGQPTQNVPSMWSPHIDVCERNGKLLIQADLPGIKRDDINVQIDQDAIVIQGQRHQQQTSNQGGYYRSERSYGSFYRSIPLPEGTNAESASASFRDGVLEIELDMPRPQQRGRTLEIRDASAGAAGTTSAPGGRAGTGSGATYGSGSTGTSQAGSSQLAASGAGAAQQSATGTMYSGSGEPATGAGAGSGERGPGKPRGSQDG